ncbi:MAG: serine hydrolase domain-containing protein [Gemmatimonadota bacterium]
MADQFAAVDALAGAFAERGGQPGLAYGVLAGGELVHARGLGERRLGGPAPDAGTVFRIASMTKSFTAAAVLLLRDEGALALADPADRYVPELKGLALPGADCPPVTLRHLLTMTAGFPTDDPWGDRQQGLPLAEFAGLLAGGVGFAWAPGTRFEYSNLGYAILGRVITAVSGQAYPEFVAQRLLRPLGMTATGYEAAGFGAGQLAGGYRHGPDGWEELAPDPCGAFAPMGGVFSCVADLARWVSGFTAAFPPGGRRAGLPHPLSAASRREMQLPQAVIPPAAFTRLPGDPAAGTAGYGFGLFTEDSAEHGRIVQHSGGYPGFGSNMRWHPASGTGVIVLANSTYAGASGLAAQLLGALLRQAPAAAGGPAVRGPAPAPGGPWPATLAARDEVSQLLQTWDDAAAARLLAENVALDEPLPERQAKAGLIRERIGAFRDDPDRPPQSDSPAHCRWWLTGERGTVTAEILLTPELPPRVQALRLAVPPAPGSALGELLETLISLLNEGAPGWPPGLAAAATVDTGLLLRQLRMAAAWAGRCAPGALRAGNGESTATIELAGEHATVSLAVAVDPASGLLQQADLLLGPAR